MKGIEDSMADLESRIHKKRYEFISKYNRSTYEELARTKSELDELNTKRQKMKIEQWADISKSELYKLL